MKIKTLYKYTRADGGTSVSPIKPDAEYTENLRLIADEGEVLTKNGVDFYACIDVESSEGWYCVPAPTEEI